MTIRFDDSLPILAKTVVALLGAEALLRAVVIRDASGRLSLVLDAEIEDDKRATCEAALAAALEGYARPDRIVSDRTHPGADILFEQASMHARVAILDWEIQFLDRRLVGADWLRAPVSSKGKIPRAVFASLKGGVGRSTALCVVAAHLSRRGRRVLAIDFDLEAPGIGTMLLRPDELPSYGTLDYLVENGLSGIDDQFIANVAADSILGAEGGRVTVVPAVGRATIQNPSEALSKIARSYIEDIRDDGTLSSLADQLREMVERFEATNAYDVVLIDSRAGLHETVAASMLGLGADVLMFGTNQPQTFLGYRLLLAHLSKFPISHDDDWRDRFWFVHAKAPEARDKQAAGDESFSALYDLLSPPIQSDVGAERLTANDIDVDWSDEEEVDVDAFERPAILHVVEDGRYRDFDPVADAALLLSDTYAGTFKELLAFADSLADISEE